MASRKPKRLSDQIRQRVRESGYSGYAICKATGLDKGQLSHFLAGHRGLSLASLDILAEFLGLEVVCKSKRKGR